MKHLLLSLLCFCALLANAHSQNVTAMSVAEFEQRISKESDTLYVYNFWATWCKPCVEELPYFIESDSLYRDKPVKVILVSLDFEGQLEAQLTPFLQKKNIQTEVWYLTDAHKRTSKGWIDRISPSWSGSIPATLLVGGTSETYTFKEATFTRESLASWLKPFLP
ncbi:MAG: redoxin domain-containing protein [Bacteroidia bacterium]